MSTVQVQATNDSSIVSKLSAANAGYFSDPCLKTFVDREQKRSALINRGYYIRFRAIDTAFLSWFEAISEISKSQVISLGAGFDSSYFRFKLLNNFPLGCKYMEIDFAPVMKRKVDFIQKSCLVIPDFNLVVNSGNNNPIAFSRDYMMLGLDLKNIPELEDCFKKLEVDFSLNTLFISECAITYMDVDSSNNLLKWVRDKFPKATFIGYEQIQPHDGFGIVMKNHFNTLGCPLKSLDSFPTLETQCERLKKLGFEYCSAIDMFNFFSHLSLKEKESLQSLELFDEYEMWHELCRHYTILNAGHVKLNFIQSSIKDSKRKTRIKWELTQSGIFLERFGHQIIFKVLGDQKLLLLSGGFGNLKKQHGRLGGLDVFHCTSSHSTSTSLNDPDDLLSKRIYHSATQLSNGSVVILGGRSAPKKVFEKVIILHFSNLEYIEKNCDITVSVTEKGSIPNPTWRHSASLVQSKASECIVIFGGCSQHSSTTSDCYMLNTETWLWSKINTQNDTPSPRHSHSSVTSSNNMVFIIGGLTEDESILNDVHAFNCDTLQWTTFNIPGLLPRYAHTSHCLGSNIFLIGGVTSSSNISTGIAIINLSTNFATELSLPIQDPEYPIILSNHCSYIDKEEILVVGGGGNCFSFGTHFNKKVVKMNLLNFKDY